MALDSRRNQTTPTRRGGIVPSPSTKTQKRPFPMPHMGHEAMVRRMEPSHNTPPSGMIMGTNSSAYPDKPPSGKAPKSSSKSKTVPAGGSYAKAAQRKLGM